MPPLVRTLRLYDLLFLFIGGVIGSGIFLTPGLVLRRVGGSVGLSLLVWSVGGILSLLGALTYAELAASNPEAGGMYCYIRDGFGRAPAFLYGWSLFLVISSGSIAALAHAFSRYLQEVVPVSNFVAQIAGLAMIAMVTAVNVWGTRKSADLQNWTTLTKAGMVIILAAVLLSLGHHYSDLTTASTATAEPGFSVASGFGLAMIAVLWAYEGWQFGTYSAGEVLKPQQTFPKAFLIGSLFLIALYLVANVAYLVALGPVAATASDAIAATAITAVLGPWAGKIVAVAILISTFSATNSVILTAPRVFYAMANDNLFFKKLAEVHPRYQTPAAAIVALGAWAAVLSCASKFAELASGAMFIGWIFYGLAAAAIFPIRKASKGLPIPYRVPGYPWTPAVFVLVAAVIVGNAVYLALTDPRQFHYLAAGIVLFLLGIPAYFFWRRRSPQP